MTLGPWVASAAQADDPALDMWQAQRTTFENYIRNMKPLDRHRLSEVLDIRIDKKFLSLRTPLNNIAVEESLRASFEGVHGLGIVSVLRDDSSTGSAEPTRFNLTIMDFPAPKQTVTLSATQMIQPNQLTISKTIQITNGPFHQVIFTQQKPPLSSGSGLVQLMITESRNQGVAPQQINLEGADFFSFVREHPQETDAYVRPLLRELGQEDVFAPDQMVAWQVFSELWKPVPSAAQRVNELLPMLGSDDYHARDMGLLHLMQMGREGAAVLIHLDRRRLSPEQNARIDRALLPYAKLSLKEVLRMRSDPGFLLDCLYSDDAALRKAAIERLRQIVRPDLAFDVNADPEARSVAVDALRAQLVPTPSGGK